MKIRCQPEDFEVTEVTHRRDEGGSYRLYELRKRSLGTLEAIDRIRRHWNLSGQQISHAGLKDRHAVTRQLITIRNGPDSDFEDELLNVCCLGRTNRPMGAEDIVANSFRIVIRSLDAQAIENIQTAATGITQNGYLNYFDSQRFGSLGVSGDFVAAHWCRRDYEKATWLALAEPNVHDSPAERRQKQILHDNWGEWSTCKDQLERSNRRSVVTYLVDHPDNFKKAFALINPDMRGLYISAFQSAVWNRMLAAAMAESSVDIGNAFDAYIRIADAKLPLPTVPVELPATFTKLPLPSIRSRNANADVQRLIETALEPYGMTRREMKIHFPRDRWFSRALRSATITPEGFSVTVADDDLYAGKKKVTAEFQLPRGCYATMLLKSLRLDDAVAVSEPPVSEIRTEEQDD